MDRAEEQYREVRTKITMLKSAANRSLKPEAGLQFASVYARLIGIHAGVASSPAQEQRGADGKDNALAVDVGLNVYAFCRGRQGEIERLPENYRIRLVDNLARHRMKNFRLDQERCRISPVAGSDHNGLTSLRKMVGLDLGERTRSSDTGNTSIPKLVASPGVERRPTQRRLPLAVGRAGMLTLARYVTLVCNLKSLHRASNIHFRHALDRIAEANVAHFCF